MCILYDGFLNQILQVLKFYDCKYFLFVVQRGKKHPIIFTSKRLFHFYLIYGRTLMLMEIYSYSYCPKPNTVQAGAMQVPHAPVPAFMPTWIQWLSRLPWRIFRLNLPVLLLKLWNRMLTQVTEVPSPTEQNLIIFLL